MLVKQSFLGNRYYFTNPLLQYLIDLIFFYSQYIRHPVEKLMRISNVSYYSYFCYCVSFFCDSEQELLIYVIDKQILACHNLIC